MGNKGTGTGDGAKSPETLGKVLIVVLGPNPLGCDQIKLLTQKAVRNHGIGDMPQGGEFLNIERIGGSDRESIMRSMVGTKLDSGKFDRVIFILDSSIPEPDRERIIEEDVLPVNFVFPKQSVYVLRVFDRSIRSFRQVKDGVLVSKAGRKLKL